VLDSDLKVVSANEAAVDSFGSGKLTLLGLSLDSLGSGELADPRLRAALERTLREGAPFRHLAIGDRRAHGARLARGENGPQLLLLLDGEEVRP
jgi:PAS domain-containing protein